MVDLISTQRHFNKDIKQENYKYQNITKQYGLFLLLKLLIGQQNFDNKFAYSKELGLSYLRSSDDAKYKSLVKYYSHKFNNRQNSIISSMLTDLKIEKPKQTHRYQTVPTQNQSSTKQVFQFNKIFYDTFAFRDRITNHQFKYKQARQCCETPSNDFDNWTANDNHKQKSLKNIVNEYKFTKKFELECLRNKYFKSCKTQNAQNDSKQLQHRLIQLKTKQHSIDKNTIYELNKQQLNRVLSQNAQVSQQIIKINKLGTKAHNFHMVKSRNHINKWDKIQNVTANDKDITIEQADIQNRINDKIINHMKYELKSNGEYLLNMSIDKKRRHLIKSQFSQSKKFKIRQYPKGVHTDISSFTFNNVQPEELSEGGFKHSHKKSPTEQDMSFINLVKQGFIHEVELQLSNYPNVFMVRDQNKNNIFHIAIKEGNQEMVKILFKIIHPRNCYSLLLGRNNLKRTPRQKAAMLCEHQICHFIDDFLQKYQAYVK